MIPAYLESTLEAVRLYEKAGFEAVVGISMNVTFDSDKADVVRGDYKEIGMVYRPKVKKETEHGLI